MGEVLCICCCEVFDDERCVCYNCVAMRDVWNLQHTLTEHRQGVKQGKADFAVSYFAVSPGSETERHCHILSIYSSYAVMTMHPTTSTPNSANVATIPPG